MPRYPDIPMTDIRLHVAIKLVLLLLSSIDLALQRTQTHKSLAWLFLSDASFAEKLYKPTFLSLLFKPLHERIIAFFAVLVCVDGHMLA
ncbi:MAG: hypothetical protein Greene041662_292 [Candidatus Peregrinibacteria bacterium Greene0416_62]|nr:MAG: hypothetical protein Greene041662_292 [Candidatus Peregrinibacteria bacterium Greene0416_62]